MRERMVCERDRKRERERQERGRVRHTKNGRDRETERLCAASLGSDKLHKMLPLHVHWNL